MNQIKKQCLQKLNYQTKVILYIKLQILWKTKDKKGAKRYDKQEFLPLPKPNVDNSGGGGA